MSRVVHFEFSADDPERVRDFFARVFGWRVERWGGPLEYWMVATGPDDEFGIDGGMGTRPTMSRGIVNTIAVDDVDATLLDVTAAGGEVVMPKSAIPGAGWNAYFKDTEGNLWGIFEADEHAG